MRIRAVMGSGWEIDDGDSVRIGCCRGDCRVAGCTEDECDRAYGSCINVRQGEWIDCPRPRTKSEAIEALTEERDALLAASKAVKSDIDCQRLITNSDTSAMLVNAAIARAEKAKGDG